MEVDPDELDRLIAKTGLRKAEIAVKLNVSPQAVSKWRHGRIRSRYWNELKKLAGEDDRASLDDATEAQLVDALRRKGWKVTLTRVED